MYRLLSTFPYFKKGTWWILSGYTLSLFGTGMSEPYLILYLHQLRTTSLLLSGMIIAMSGFAGAVCIPLSGWLTDLLGTKRTFLYMLILDATGRIILAFAEYPETAFLAAFISGAGACKYMECFIRNLS